MNERFYSLPLKKQEAIINAGFSVFSKNSYKKSPMNEIAAAAGISKSLLFHYFHNKKELYLFLWEKCAEFTIEALEKSGCYDQKDLFDTLYMGMSAKLQIMRQYPDLGAFAMKVYYEKDPAVCTDISKIIERYMDYKAHAALLDLDPDQFIPGLDIEMMYHDMYWATEGYLWEKIQQGSLDIDAIEQDFLRLIGFWRSVYARKETQHERYPDI